MWKPEGVFGDRVIAGELSGKHFPRDLRSRERLVLNSQLFHPNLLTAALLMFSVNSALPLAGFVARPRSATEQERCVCERACLRQKGVFTLRSVVLPVGNE